MLLVEILRMRDAELLLQVKVFYPHYYRRNGFSCRQEIELCILSLVEVGDGISLAKILAKLIVMSFSCTYCLCQQIAIVNLFFAIYLLSAGKSNSCFSSL